MRAADMLDKTKWPGAHHIAHRIERVLLQLGGGVHAIEWIGEGIDQRAVRLFQIEHDGERIRRVDRIDVGHEPLANRDDALRRIANAIVARLDVLGGEWRAVVEFHVRMQLECIGLRIWRDGPALGEIADDLRIVRRVDLEQVGIVRREQMNDREQYRLVTVVGRRIARIDAEHECAAAHRLLLSMRLAENECSKKRKYDATQLNHQDTYFSPNRSTAASWTSTPRPYPAG